MLRELHHQPVATRTSGTTRTCRATTAQPIARATARPGSRAAEGGLDAYAGRADRRARIDRRSRRSRRNDVRPGSRPRPRDRNGDPAPATMARRRISRPARRSGRTSTTSAPTCRQADGQDDLVRRGRAVDRHPRSPAVPDGQVRRLQQHDRPVARTAYADPFFAADQRDPPRAIRTQLGVGVDAGSAYPANYLLASDPQKLIDGLRAAFARISTPTGTLSAAALTSANLTYGSAGAYVTTFDPSKWSGSVLLDSLSVDPQRQPRRVDAGVGRGCAADRALRHRRVGVDRLQGQRHERQRSATSSPRSSRTAFAWPSRSSVAAISADAALPRDAEHQPGDRQPDGNAQQRVDYLRGYRADESSALGVPAARLGDGRRHQLGPGLRRPADVLDPRRRLPDVLHRQRRRRPAVYVGANDGMLHALRRRQRQRRGGNELFAYVPGYSHARPRGADRSRLPARGVRRHGAEGPGGRGQRHVEDDARRRERQRRARHVRARRDRPDGVRPEQGAVRILRRRRRGLRQRARGARVREAAGRRHRRPRRSTAISRSSPATTTSAPRPATTSPTRASAPTRTIGACCS